jgi:2-dehydropantoate 2-reductase
MTPSIAIIGTGAIGGYYGVRLALSGADVRFLLRRDLAHVREQGFTLRERDGVRKLERVAAFGRTEDIGPVDYVLVTLKTTANAELPGLLAPLLGPQTRVVTLQNGLGNEEAMAAMVGGERVLGALCYIGVTRDAPGELTGHYTPGAMTIGAYGRPPGPATRPIAEALERAGVKVRLADNLAEARWQKLVWNVPFNGLAIARGGITTDKIVSDPELTAEARGLMLELAQAGRRMGFEVTDKFIDWQFEITPGMGAYRPSSLVDFLAGREVELEAIWGEPLRRGQAAGVPMPRLEALYRDLQAATGKQNA